MRFLAAESCDAAIVRALRVAGYDLKAVSDTMRGAPDPWVLGAALHERRILLTEDKDFGELVFATEVSRAAAISVVLFRYPPAARPQLVRTLVDFVATRQAELAGAFVVLSPARARIRKIPQE